MVKYKPTCGTWINTNMALLKYFKKSSFCLILMDPYQNKCRLLVYPWLIEKFRTYLMMKTLDLKDANTQSILSMKELLLSELVKLLAQMTEQVPVPAKSYFMSNIYTQRTCPFF